MRKINDRFWLGTISGLGGNLAKLMAEQLFNRIGFTKTNGYTTAAGIFLKKSKVASPYGRAVGILADNMIAVGLGVTCTYWLTLMGKDRFLIKGAGLGAAEWASLYGVVSKLGATTIYPVKPQDALATFVSHLLFGLTKTTIAVTLGDERLFKPKNLTLEINHPQSFKPKPRETSTNSQSLRYLSKSNRPHNFPHPQESLSHFPSPS
ncbi:hypothetical protein REC12_06765 [Desulfosporosinus sp. PR]|uniref:hypothetical protein n=1 Tax=Candidatus Desulfosporosinus nitrosoreducens TaxID=3401928 RepID=UPI0027FD0FAC|nr:hypothetical protein [Desulfosporosinus sp. PR]MDQ7093287.1 hypothetical protein [Desulfosporosinus sp. PR]